MKNKISIYKILIAVVFIVVGTIVTFFPGIFNKEKDENIVNFDQLSDLLSVPDRSSTALVISSENRKTSLNVEVVNTTESRQMGLSGRQSFPDQKGMLFVFPQSSQYSFWMKDMLFPLDIIWINASGTIVHIEKNKSPDTYPNAFKPDQLAQFVLEVNAGFTDFFEIKVGDTVSN